MAEHYFVDSTFLVARFNPKDVHHKQALGFFAELAARPTRAPPLTLTDYIVDETLTTVLYRTGRHDLAVAAGERMVGSRGAEVLFVERNTVLRAWELFRDRSDKKWSFTDCVSFTVMEELGLRTALSFDSNFKEAGFAMLP